MAGSEEDSERFSKNIMTRVLSTEAPENVGKHLIAVVAPFNRPPGSQPKEYAPPMSPAPLGSSQPGSGSLLVTDLIFDPDLGDRKIYSPPWPVQKQDKDKPQTLGIRTFPLQKSEGALNEREEKLAEREEKVDERVKNLDEQEKTLRSAIEVLNNQLIVEKSEQSTRIQHLCDENVELKRQLKIVLEEKRKSAQEIDKLKEITKDFLKGAIDGIVDFQNREAIGYGSEGTSVFRAKYYLTEKDVAVKEMLKDRVSRKYFSDREHRHFLETIGCPYIVKLVDYVETDRRFWYLCIELCQASLYEYVEGDCKITFLRELKSRSEYERRCLSIRLLDQSMEGLQYLHSKDIVHRDMKPHNILLCWDPKSKDDECIKCLTAKISDLGLSKKFVKGESVSVTKGLRGTLGWAAPEMKEETIIEAVDIFTMGCVTQFVLFGVHPFGKEEHRSRNIDVHESVDLHKADFLTLKLIEEMISKDPHDRPTCTEVRSHCLFWDERKQITFFDAVNNCFPIKRSEKIDDSQKECALLFLDNKECEIRRRFPEERFIPCSSPLCIYENGSSYLANWRNCADFFLPVEEKDAKYDVEDGKSARQLIRYMRNKIAHSTDKTAGYVKLRDIKTGKANALRQEQAATKRTKEILGEHPDEDIPDGPKDIIVLRYVLAWFPNLLVHTYNVIERFFKKEGEFKEFFECPKLLYI